MLTLLRNSKVQDMLFRSELRRLHKACRQASPRREYKLCALRHQVWLLYTYLLFVLLTLLRLPRIRQYPFLLVN